MGTPTTADGWQPVALQGGGGGGCFACAEVSQSESHSVPFRSRLKLIEAHRRPPTAGRLPLPAARYLRRLIASTSTSEALLQLSTLSQATGWISDRARLWAGVVCASLQLLRVNGQCSDLDWDWRKVSDSVALSQCPPWCGH
ncbi:Hypothetical predicted protein [Drosophila guanche]|uniref:Uncharacterized protein n=1 Tax=Drosophila guanche TaxID=7266 RepID=A0A3B0JGH1_DROGU|nr:Hypothetical predicted protein [Drosophila guanche]